MYSLLYCDNNKTAEKKVAKEIAKDVTKKKIRHEHYKVTMFIPPIKTDGVNAATPADVITTRDANSEKLR